MHISVFLDLIGEATFTVRLSKHAVFKRLRLTRMFLWSPAKNLIGGILYTFDPKR